MLPVIIYSQFLPKRDPRNTDHRKDRPEDKPGRKFPAHDAPPVLQFDFLQCKRTNDKGGCLRTGIPPRTHDERDEQRQHDGSFELVRKMLHRACGQHLAQKQGSEPARALLDQGQKSYAHIRTIDRFHATEFLNVFRGLCDHRIESSVLPGRSAIFTSFQSPLRMAPRKASTSIRTSSLGLGAPSARVFHMSLPSKG